MINEPLLSSKSNKSKLHSKSLNCSIAKYYDYDSSLNQLTKNIKIRNINKNKYNSIQFSDNEDKDDSYSHWSDICSCYSLCGSCYLAMIKSET